MAKGGRKAPDNKPRGPSGPGALSRRTDMSAGGTQPIRAPTGGDYGDREALIAQQHAAPVPEGGPPVSGGMPPTPSTSDIHGLLTSVPTQRPDESMVPPGASSGMALKVDALRHLATLPYASPEVTALLEAATAELQFAQQPAPPAMPGAPTAPPMMQGPAQPQGPQGPPPGETPAPPVGGTPPSQPPPSEAPAA